MNCGWSRADPPANASLRWKFHIERRDVKFSRTVQDLDSVDVLFGAVAHLNRCEQAFNNYYRTLIPISEIQDQITKYLPELSRDRVFEYVLIMDVIIQITIIGAGARSRFEVQFAVCSGMSDMLGIGALSFPYGDHHHVSCGAFLDRASEFSPKKDPSFQDPLQLASG